LDCYPLARWLSHLVGVRQPQLKKRMFFPS
jgi:hypothetical protein